MLTDGAGNYKGRLWVYLDPIGRRVVFDATRTHERDGPERFLAPFTGVLQADAYIGYDALYRTGRIVEVGCWAHARRRFVEAFSTDSGAARTLALIQQLYEIERNAADVPPEERQRRRREHALPVLAQLNVERARLTATVLPKSPLGDAVRYLTNQWAALQRFVDDGRVSADNNRAENQLRVVAVGRNYAESAITRSCPPIGTDSSTVRRRIQLAAPMTHSA